MAGIFDSFNTPIPNLVSGSSLTSSAVYLNDAYNKLFGTGKGGVLDFLDNQQEQIRTRNTQDMTQRMKSLTPDQLRQLEDAGINPYTDLPAMFGANNGVLVDTKKAFEGADTAGANLKTANNNTLNTWLNQLNNQQKADFVAQGGDVPLNMLNTFKQQNNRPEMRFFDETAFRTNADPAYNIGYKTLLDEASKANANNGTALDRYNNPDNYVLPRDVSPDLEKQLRMDMATTDKNRVVQEAAYAIHEYMKINKTNDWRAAGQALGISEDIMNSIDLDKLPDMFDKVNQENWDTFSTTSGRVQALKEKYANDYRRYYNERMKEEYDGTLAGTKRVATDWTKTKLQDLLKNDFDASTFENLDEIQQIALEKGLTNQEFEEILTKNTNYPKKLSKFTNDILQDYKEEFKDAFKPDENNKYNLEKIQKASSAIMELAKTKFERYNVPKALIPFMTQQMITSLSNDKNMATFANGKTNGAEIMKASLELSNLAGTNTTLQYFTKNLFDKTISLNPYNLIMAVPKAVKDNQIEQQKVENAISNVWDTKVKPSEKWINLSTKGREYILYSIFAQMRQNYTTQEAFTNAAIDILNTNTDAQVGNLKPGALALSKVEKLKSSQIIDDYMPGKDEKENSK